LEFPIPFTETDYRRLEAALKDDYRLEQEELVELLLIAGYLALLLESNNRHMNGALLQLHEISPSLFRGNRFGCIHLLLFNFLNISNAFNPLVAMTLMAVNCLKSLDLLSRFEFYYNSVYFVCSPNLG
jgi:hypothetical protein